MNIVSCICHCPYPDCNISIEIVEINCSIFRCGVYKQNGRQIDPHLPKEQCYQLKKEDKIWGCGRPFQLIITNGNYKFIQCEYI